MLETIIAGIVAQSLYTSIVEIEHVEKEVAQSNITITEDTTSNITWVFEKAVIQ